MCISSCGALPQRRAAQLAARACVCSCGYLNSSSTKAQGSSMLETLMGGKLNAESSL
jgi:hypothetical protein